MENYRVILSIAKWKGHIGAGYIGRELRGSIWTDDINFKAIGVLIVLK